MFVAKRGNPNMRKGAPSVNPDGRRGRIDGVFNAFSGHGTADDASSYTRHLTRAINDERALDLRRGNWIAKRICEWLPQDVFRKGYTIKLEDKGQAEEVNAVGESLCLNQRVAEAGAMARTCGGAALLPVLDGAVGDLSEPLDLDNPRILDVKAIHMLEPRELMPISYYDDIMNPKFRKPERYQVMTLGGRRTTTTIIHESRMAIFYGDRVSVEDQAGQREGWGDGKLVPVEKIIHGYELSWGSAETIMRNFSERIQAIEGLEKILAHKEGAATLMANLKRLDLLRSTLRTRVVSASAALSESAKSVAGMAELLIQDAQRVSGAGDIPMTRLFGMSPAGMNATGEFDLVGVHERVAAEQTHVYTPIVEWLIRLILLSADGPTQGEEPDVWSIEWLPLKQQSEKEIAETRKIVAETDQIYADMGVPALEIIKARFGGDTYSMETTIDVDEVEAQIAEKERAAEEMAKQFQQQPVPGAEQTPPNEDDHERGDPAA